jgi:hypothetical protein
MAQRLTHTQRLALGILVDRISVVSRAMLRPQVVNAVWEMVFHRAPSRTFLVVEF